MRVLGGLFGCVDSGLGSGWFFFQAVTVYCTVLCVTRVCVCSVNPHPPISPRSIQISSSRSQRLEFLRCEFADDSSYFKFCG